MIRSAQSLRTTLALALAGASFATHAQVPQAEREALIDFYQATGGAQWINDEGWLGEVGTECSWHGVTCADDEGQLRVDALILPDNGLSGDLPDGLDRLAALTMLDVSSNSLTGTIPDDLASVPITTLYLENNQLSGPLPEWIGQSALRFFDVSGNALSGTVPAAFAEAELVAVDLSDNDLSGSIDAIYAGLAPPDAISSQWLLLAGNAFSGPLPAGFDPSRFSADDDFNLEYDAIVHFGIRGLDLCWNELTIEPSQVEAINPAHRGGSLQACRDRARTAITPRLSGSWYVPERSGEGITQMLLDNGRILTYWFTYSDAPSFRPQRWLVGVGHPESLSTGMVRLQAPSGGVFSEGFGTRPRGQLMDRAAYRQSPLSDEAAHFAFDTADDPICLTGLCSWVSHNLRFDQRRLSELAGTTCENQSDFQDFSGAWYNPERSGEGFIVEVLPDDRVVAYWFTYRPDGSGQQAWMIGDGAFESPASIVTPPPDTEYSAALSMYQPIGAAFGEAFNPEAVEVQSWGTLSLTFLEGGGGEVSWESDLPEYGSGSYPIERLARPMLAECEQEAGE